MGRINYHTYLVFYFSSIILTIYNIPLGPLNLSVDRLLVIPSLFLILVFFNYRIPGIVGSILFLSVTSILSLLLNTETELNSVLKLLPSYVLCLLILYNSAKSAFHFNKTFVTKILYYNWIIITFFTFYGFYHRYILNEIYFQYPLNQFLGDLSSDEHKINMLRYYRLFFPMSSAPRLGFVAVVLLLYHLYIERLIRKMSWIVTFTLIFTIILTISRGPIVALGLTIWLAQLLKAYRQSALKQFFIFHFFLLFSLTILFIISYYLSQDFKSFSRLLAFASDDDNSFQGHLGIRIRVLNEIANSNIKSIFFGHGLGHFESQMGTSSAHSSIFTQVFEQGIFGLVAYLTIYITPILIGLKTYTKFPNNLTLGLFQISLFLFLLHFTYDAITTANLWLYQGLIWGLQVKIKSIYAKSKYNYTCL